MADDKTGSSYVDLVKQREAGAKNSSAESKLDVLLVSAGKLSRERQAAGEALAKEPSRLDVFRETVRTELIPAFRQIQQKYAARGIELWMDASDFLDGGRMLFIEIAIKTYATRLDGTVTETGIAFNEIRAIGGVDGAICSGPMLRIRRLTPEKFREFVCGHIAMLVQSVLRERR